jgi:hypothetical protein
MESDSTCHFIHLAITHLTSISLLVYRIAASLVNSTYGAFNIKPNVEHSHEWYLIFEVQAGISRQVDLLMR